MSYNDLASKVEHALQSHLASVAPAGTVVLTGSDDATKTLPQVICSCQDIGREDPLNSGNYHATAMVSVVSAVKSGLTAHRQTVATIFDNLRVTNSASTISSALADFTVFGMTCEGMGRDNTEHSFSDYITLNLYCCASDIT